MNSGKIMNRYYVYLLVLLVGLASSALAQIRIIRTEKVPLAQTHAWSHPQFSPTGGSVYFTDMDGNGIWEYSLKARTTRQITSDPKAGLAFTVSSDGKSMLYRRTLTDRSGRTRNQDIVLMNIAKRSSSVLASGSDVSAPAFAGNVPVYAVRSKTEGLSKVAGTRDITVLGIEDQKIALSINGKKTLMDPLGNGSYIWPALSPDKQLLVAYEMDRGAFVADLQGTVISKLGRRDAPNWTRSGKWIVYMNDKDDGNKLLSSDIFAISPDGKSVVQLTSTSGIMELNPQCSPTENKIVCNTSGGAVLILEYEEQQ
jgi:Tol biopolymer transport system component